MKNNYPEETLCLSASILFNYQRKEMVSRTLPVGDANKLVPMQFNAKCTVEDDGTILLNKMYKPHADTLSLFDQNLSSLKVQCNGMPRFMPKYPPSRDNLRQYIRDYAMELMFTSEWLNLHADKMEAAVLMQLNKRGLV